MNYLRESTSATISFGPFVDEEDGKTVETSLVISATDIYISKNGLVQVSKDNSVSGVHDRDGNYLTVFDSSDTSATGTLRLYCHITGALPVWEDYLVLSQTAYDSLVAGTTKLDVDSTNIQATVDVISADTDEMQGKLPINYIMGSGVATNQNSFIDAILTDTNEMQGKLPTNNIMGSSVKTNKDDEIDAILADTADIQTTVDTISADIETLNDLSKEDIANAMVDTSISGATYNKQSVYGNLNPLVVNTAFHELSGVASGDVTYEVTTYGALFTSLDQTNGNNELSTEMLMRCIVKYTSENESSMPILGGYYFEANNNSVSAVFGVATKMGIVSATGVTNPLFTAGWTSKDQGATGQSGWVFIVPKQGGTFDHSSSALELRLVYGPTSEQERSTVLYVDATMFLGSNGGTIDKPIKSLSRAVQMLPQGGKIVLLSDVVLSSDTLTMNNIVLECQGGMREITGENCILNNCTVEGITLSASVVTGSTVRNSVITLNDSPVNSTFENCKIITEGGFNATDCNFDNCSSVQTPNLYIGLIRSSINGFKHDTTGTITFSSLSASSVINSTFNSIQISAVDSGSFHNVHVDGFLNQGDATGTGLFWGNYNGVLTNANPTGFIVTQYEECTSATADLTNVQTTVDSISAQTDQMAFTDGNIDSNIVAISGDTSAVENFRKGLQTTIIGTVVADGLNSTTIFETNLTQTTNDIFVPSLIAFLSGNLKGSRIDISDYNGSTKFITVGTALPLIPSTGSEFIIT